MKLILFLILSINTLGNNKTLCGTEDNRVLSKDTKVGRVFMDMKAQGGCTATLISKDCVITAGHCADILGYVEFNTGESKDFKTFRSKPEDIYPVLMHTIRYNYVGIGQDWAVAKLESNINGKDAGDVQGFYDIEFNRPKDGTPLRITGYGIDRVNGNKNMAQQTASGNLLKLPEDKGTYIISHTVDTMGGSSGSSIINVDTNKIIGVHTNGGCGVTQGTNSGTYITRTGFKRAILECINGEK